MDKSVLKQFLKAGFIFQDKLFPTDEGTPQGGVISPILANMTLDGLQDALAACFATNGKGHVCHHVQSRNRVNLIRYADDFIVTAATREIAESAKEVIRDFLRVRGLELSEDGFDMLGWTFRKFKGKLITKPSKKAIKAFSAILSETILRRGKAWPQDLPISKLNQQIRMAETGYFLQKIISCSLWHTLRLYVTPKYEWRQTPILTPNISPTEDFNMV